MSSFSTRAKLAAAGLPTALLTLALVSPVPAAAITAWNPALLRAPYLTDLVALHVNVNWATDQSASTGSLRWGPVAAGVCTLPNTLTATRSTITVGSVSEYQWKASLSLPSQGQYCYRPLLASTDLLAANASPQFQTQVAAGDSTSFSFDVFGDWGQVDSTGASADQSNLFAQVAASGARFAVTVGDNGYPNGSQLNYGDLRQTGTDTSAIFGPSFWTAAGSSIPLFTAAGNHGLSGPAHTDITTWTQDTAVSSSGGRYQNDVYCCVNGTSSANYGSEWYAFDAGMARFYVLDSAWGDSNVGTATVYANDAAAHFAPGTPEYQWLLNDLKTHSSSLKFAFSHYPFYADNPNQSSDTSLQGVTGLEGMLGQYGVKIVFNGHAHIYERNTPSAPGMPVSYVTGGGGATLEPIGACHSYDAYGLGWSPSKLTGTRCGSAPVPTAAAQVFHFLKVTVSGMTVTVAPTDENGHTFDVQSYTFSKVPDTVIDSAPPLTTGTAILTFHSTLAGATFACRLDGGSASACTSPVTYTGLSDGQHTFTVAATTSGGTDPTPATAQWTVDTSPPSTPTNLVGTSPSATVASLSWTASTDNNGVTGYDVQRNGVTIGSATAPSTSYLDTTDSPSTSYQYTVIARDAAGNTSAASAPVTVTTPPSTGAPTLVQSAGSSTSTVTLPGTSANGDLLVLTAGVYTGATKQITAVSDGKNTWTKVGAYTVAGQNSDGELWYAANAAPVRTITVTTTAVVALRAKEFTGVVATNPLDAAVGTAATSNSANSGSVTPAAGGELAIGFVAGHASTQAISVTSPGYTVDPQQTTSGTSIVSVVSGSQVLPGTAVQSFAASFPNTMYWSAGIALFKPAAPPPPPNDFSISAAPSSVSVTAGQSGSSTINTAVTSGSAQSVALSASGMPAGVSVSFSPTSVTAGASSAMSITVGSAVAAGSYPLTVTGTGASVTHTASVSLTVNAVVVDDFSISAAPSSVSVTAGQSGSSTINTAVTSGSAQSVALSASGMPAGVSVSFSPTSVTAGASSAMSITVGSGVAAGTYPLTVTGTGASATHTTSVSLTVNAVVVDDFSIGAAPSSVTVTAGQSGTSTISTAVTSGNPQPVGLSVSTPPTGVTVSFNPTSVTAGAGSVLTIDTATSAATGTVTLTVTGTGASVTHTASVSLTVNAVVTDDFSIGAAPSSVTVTAGQSGTSTISTAVTSGNAQSVALSASGLPSGVSVSFNPATVTADGSSVLTISTAANTAAGTVTLTVTGTGPSATHTASVSLTVNAVVTDDFSIGAAPTSASVTAGQTATSTISTAVTSGNAQSISLSASGTPSGATVSFTPATLTAGQSSTFAVATTSGTPAGTYSLTVTGTGTSATHTVTVSLTVTGGATPLLVQAVGATETSTSTSLTANLPTASNAGDLLVLSASVYTGATNNLTSITDSAGNVWKKIRAANTASHNSDGELWYAANAAPVTSVTAHLGAAATMAFEVQEFSGIAANPLDVSAGASNTGTSANSGPLTPAASGELIVGFVAGHANAQAITVTPAGYTVLPQQTSTGSVASVVTGYQVLNPASAISFAGSYPTAMYWAACVAAFKPA